MSATAVTPVKGLRFEHATATQPDFENGGRKPAVLIVSSVSKDVVYVRTHLGDRVKIARQNWEKRLGKVLYNPADEVKQKSTTVKIKLSDCQGLFDKADAAGKAAAAAKVPTPMIVAQHTNPFDDSSPVVKAWVVNSGVCGFAWVNVTPGNSTFAKWLRDVKGSHKGYRGGVNYWVGGYEQSMELKEAYASAFARVLRDAGIKAYAESRLD